MIITNTPDVPGKTIKESLGVVRGNTVRAKHIGKDIVASLRGIVGGEIPEYTDLLTDARNQALERMTEEATKLKADAVVNIRFVTSSVYQGMSELLVYGTAVKLK